MAKNQKVKCKICFIFSIILLLTTAFDHGLWAAASFDKYMSASLGMANITFTENQSTLEDDNELNDNTPASGAASVISLDISYDVPLDIKKTAFFRGVFPFMTATGSSLIFLGGGMNYFFKSMSSSSSGLTSGAEIKIFPKWRYYIGGQAGVAYLIYTTETAKKSDIMLELGVQAGAIYGLGDKWGIKIEGLFGRGSGTAASATNIRFFAGMTYTLGN